MSLLVKLKAVFLVPSGHTKITHHWERLCNCYRAQAGEHWATGAEVQTECSAAGAAFIGRLAFSVSPSLLLLHQEYNTITQSCCRNLAIPLQPHFPFLLAAVLFSAPWVCALKTQETFKGCKSVQVLHSSSIAKGGVKTPSIYLWYCNTPCNSPATGTILGG